MTYQQVARDVKNGQVAPLYLFYGTEDFLISELTAFMERQLVTADTRDFNYSVYDLKEAPLQQLLEDAETYPFMADKRMVVGQNALFLTGNKTKHAVEHDVDALIRYVQDPPDYTTVVLIVPHDKLDERKKVVKALKSKAVVTPFLPLKGKELEDWVRKRAKFYQADIDPEAVQLLVALVGASLQMLDQELNKLSLYAGSSGTITREMAEMMVSRSLEQNIFTLVDRVAHLRLDDAFQILYDLLKNKEEPIRILSLLARQFRIILQVKILSEKGYSQKQVASQLKLHPYVVKLASQQGRQLQESTLRNILKHLAEEDVRMKTGQTDRVLALEMFLLKLKEWVM
ncbi:MAG: DNA polymerase III subunit delta [Bacillaceae bacterium]|nr:DNA polymerase III subunit delta [Bacillaceae bacterium]